MARRSHSSQLGIHVLSQTGSSSLLWFLETNRSQCDEWWVKMPNIEHQKTLYSFVEILKFITHSKPPETLSPGVYV